MKPTPSVKEPLRIGVAVTEDGTRICGHAGQARHWLLFELQPGGALKPPLPVVLAREQLPHRFRDDGPHPLHGVRAIVAGSAGDGFVRHMGQWGAQVLLTGDSDPRAAVEKILAGLTLSDPDFDLSTALCRLRDLFSRH